MSRGLLGRLLLLGLGALCLVQWALPTYLIHRGQTTLEQGRQYRFRTAPVDPADPFRGRYVALDFEAARLALRTGADAFEAGQRVQVPIVVGADGFATLGAPVVAVPASSDYLQARVQWVNNGELGLRLPFDRYYMDERAAPEAERRYWEASRRAGATDAEDARRPAFVTVRVRSGYAVLEDLYIDGRPVRELPAVDSR